MKPVVKIKGYRGAWYADVEGHRLAVLHDSWWKPPLGYFDPMIGVDLNGSKYRDLVERLRNSEMAIVQRDKDVTLSRDGYVGVFRFTNPVIGVEGSIKLDLIQRIASSDR